MYIFYLDESGDPSAWEGHRHFVIAGVAVHEGQIEALSRQLAQVQEKYFPGISIPIPFHATDIRGHRKQFEHLSFSVREEILESVYRVIRTSHFPDLIVFAAVLDMNYAKDYFHARHVTFEEVCSAFNNFLIWQHRQDFTTKGMVVLDRNREEHYRQLLSDFKKGTKYGYLGNVVDIPYFATCRETRMLQLADFCANAVFRHYEKKDSKAVNMILPKVYRLPGTSTLDGLRHLTKNENCDCIACISKTKKLG